MRNVLAAGAMALAGLGLSTSANAANVAYNGAGGFTLPDDGSLLLTYLGFEAAFQDTLFALSMSGVSGPLFVNDTNAAGDIAIIGPYDILDQPVTFSLEVDTDKDGTIDYTLSSTNPLHFQVLSVVGNVFTVGFEDILNGGDQDFNDLVFTIQEVPLPGAAALLLSGLAGLGFASRRKARA